MRVLAACEESQAVCSAFRAIGHSAYSCDLKDSSGNLPQFHIKGDVVSVIESNSWDLIIAFPPCTYLSKAGACNLIRNGNIIDIQRYENMLKAKEFFMYFYNLTGCKVAIENPVPMSLCGLPPFSQTIQPYQFGDNYTKLTCLWLKELPLLFPSCYCTNSRSPKFIPSWTAEHSSAAIRSKTFNGIAQAMALQWGL